MTYLFLLCIHAYKNIYTQTYRFDGHEGAKGARVTFLGKRDTFMTIGFSKQVHIYNIYTYVCVYIYIYIYIYIYSRVCMCKCDNSWNVSRSWLLDSQNMYLIMCVCVCVCVCICMHVCSTCMRTTIVPLVSAALSAHDICVCLCRHRHIYAWIMYTTFICIYIYIYTHICIAIQAACMAITHGYMQSDWQIYQDTYILTYIHAYIYTWMHT
jgi:hypothetical protein